MYLKKRATYLLFKKGEKVELTTYILLILTYFGGVLFICKLAKFNFCRQQVTK